LIEAINHEIHLGVKKKGKVTNCNLRSLGERPLATEDIVSTWNCGWFDIDYTVPRTWTKFGDRAFSVAIPVVWNRLPAAWIWQLALCAGALSCRNISQGSV